MDIKVLYSTHYYGRDIFLLDINGFWTTVYRSSGLSGTGHGGNIIPFLWLNTRESIRTPVGYIFKEFAFNQKFITHDKSFYEYGKVEDFLEHLKNNVLNSYTLEQFDFSTAPSKDEITNRAIEINNEIKQLIQNKTIFDWNTLN